MVYTSRPDDASYQVMMWLPYLQRAGLRFIIIARNAIPAAVLAELTDVPVVEARGIADLDALVVPSLKAAFYVNASSGNGALVRFQHLTHIYLGHGDSDKPPSYNPTHAMYDQIFAAGPAATRRYAAHGVRIPGEKFTIVGRPQVENVKQSTTRIADVPEPTVLYAPTWRGHVEETMLYSLPLGERIVSALLARGATVIFRPHPFSYDFPDDEATIARITALLEADRRKTGRPHLWGAAAEKDRSILDCINDSDAMVSDVSSVVSDYLFSGKPFAMIAVPAEPEAFVVEYPVARASYVIRADLADLDAAAGEDAWRRSAGCSNGPTSVPTTSVIFRPTATHRPSSMRCTMCPASRWRTWKMIKLRRRAAEQGRPRGGRPAGRGRGWRCATWAQLVQVRPNCWHGSGSISPERRSRCSP